MNKVIHRCLVLATLLIVVPFSAVVGATTPAPSGAHVYFIQPKDGETVPETFTVVVGVRGMRLLPAGPTLPNTGHHHLLIDVDSLENFSLPLPKNTNIQHLDRGEDRLRLTLPRGRHTLQVLMADGEHIPHTHPVLSEKITINVR